MNSEPRNEELNPPFIKAADGVHDLPRIRVEAVFYGEPVLIRHYIEKDLPMYGLQAALITEIAK